MRPFVYKNQIINLDLCKSVRLIKGNVTQDYIQIDDITLSPDNPQEVFEKIKAIMGANMLSKKRRIK